jgi:hypothetical protein
MVKNGKAKYQVKGKKEEELKKEIEKAKEVHSNEYQEAKY